jgi:hypothetical protein
MKRYFYNILLTIDLAADTVLFGSSPFEPISTRIWRNRERSFCKYFAIPFVDWIFEFFFDYPDHCKRSIKVPQKFLDDYEMHWFGAEPKSEYKEKKTY